MNLPVGQLRLLALLALLAVVAGVRYGGGLFGSPGGEDLRRVLRGEERVRSPMLAVEVLELRLADLDNVTGEFRPGRDPWRFAPRQRPRQPPPPPPPPVAAPAPPPRSTEPAPPPKPQPPPVDVVFLGSFGPSSRRIAVFSDDQAIYNAGTGDTVKGKFEVFKIGYESVQLTFVGFPDSPPEQLKVGG